MRSHFDSLVAAPTGNLAYTGVTRNQRRGFRGGRMKNLFLCLAAVCFMLGGRGAMAENGGLQTIESVPAAVWQNLSTKKIYFGHQSVGENIMDGVAKIMKSSGSIQLNIVKTDDPRAFARPVFAHSYVGKNGDTNSKIAAFRDAMQKGIGNRADIAFFKFCFWDIRSRTDVKAVFDAYKTALSELKRKYPKTTFVHFTVPLMEYPNRIKDKILRAFNMKNEADLANIKRNELNELLVKEYAGREPVFDIAKIESTLPGGGRTFFSKDGNVYYYLAAEYTNDGGHLNEAGRRRAASRLLVFLSDLSAKADR
jgi:hypothetical protein